MLSHCLLTPYKKMATLLRIDASARYENSVSRRLADQVQTAWTAAHPTGTIVRRDLAAQPVSHVSETTIQGFYATELDAELIAATQLSDELIDELLSADEILLSTPMYNFSVPSALKAYIDQIVRINKTFAVVDGTLQGLVPNKRVYVALAEGAAYREPPLAEYDFLQPYLTKLFGFLGMQDMVFLTVDSTTLDPAAQQVAQEAATARINELFTLHNALS